MRDVYVLEAEIYELLELIVTEQTIISEIEIQHEIDRVMQAIKFTSKAFPE
jgi:hypothetical protein